MHFQIAGKSIIQIASQSDTADFKSMYGFDETVLLDLCLQLFVMESRNRRSHGRGTVL
jgi:hypothetical protein